MQFNRAQTTMSTAETTFTDIDVSYDFEHEGMRLGLWERVVYACLVMLGKRRAYPICICAFSRDD